MAFFTATMFVHSFITFGVLFQALLVSLRKVDCVYCIDYAVDLFDDNQLGGELVLEVYFGLEYEMSLFPICR